jgi:hypothetical protein
VHDYYNAFKRNWPNSISGHVFGAGESIYLAFLETYSLISEEAYDSITPIKSLSGPVFSISVPSNKLIKVELELVVLSESDLDSYKLGALASIFEGVVSNNPPVLTIVPVSISDALYDEVVDSLT